MKVVLTVILLFGMVWFAWADVTAEIISYDKDDNGKIRVWTVYSIDGVEVPSQYPKIDGHSVYVSGRYSAHNLAGFTDEQIEKRILYDAQVHCENLIRQEFIEKTISTNDEILDKYLKTLIGKTVTETQTELKIDDETTINIKTDGTATLKPVSIQ